MEMKQAVAGLSALAHTGRLSAFRLLVRAGQDGIPAGELARRLGMAPNTLSGSLAILSHAGLIEGRRAGKSVIYAVRYGEMTRLLQFLMDDCCAGSAEICAPLMALGLGCDGVELARA